MRKLAGHTAQPKGKTALTPNHHASKGAKSGVNFMPGPTTLIKGDYEKNAATNAANFERIGMSKGPKGSYDTSAHSGNYHGKGGHAVGSSGDDGQPHYDARTYAEGRPLKGADTGPNFVPAHAHRSGKADHHPGAGSAHVFPSPMRMNAHGFGHTASKGPLRLSGHSGAHRLGSRSK